MLSFLLLSVALAMPVRHVSTEALLHSPTRHVRATDRGIEFLLKIGAEHSATFARLLAQLEASDVMVYIERSHQLPASLDGRLLVMPVTGPVRYVRIQIGDRPEAGVHEAVALIAHELRHAVEIAGAPEVHDDATLAAFYTRIGKRSIGENFFDTIEARAVGARVRKELEA